MLRCTVLDDYQNIARSMADWSDLDGVVEIETIGEHLQATDLIPAIENCDIVVAMRERTAFPAELFDRLPALKLLITTGMRNVAIDLTAAAAHGVVVCGTASASEPPLELTWALLLALARNITAEDARFHAGGAWQTTIGDDLFGRRLGLIGLGKIGSRMAVIGRAFGMEVAAWSPNLTAQRCADAGVVHAGSLLELLGSSSFVSIHMVLGDSTRGLIGAAELAAMQPTAYLINTSRAGIVDSGALVQALRDNVIAGAGVDVFEAEPLPLDDPLRSLPNLLATPHLGYVSRRNYGEHYFPQVVEDIAQFVAGSPVRVLNGHW